MARTPFKLKSGNNIKSSFKMMGSSPAKDTKDPAGGTDPMSDEQHKKMVPHNEKGEHEWKSPVEMRSPVKKLSPEVYVDDVLVERGSGKGKEAVEEGINVEKANTKKYWRNIEANQEAYDQALRNVKDGVNKEQNMAIMDNIEKGNFEGGEAPQTVRYTGEESKQRDLIARGLKPYVRGEIPSEEKIGIGPDVKQFDTDEEYQQWLRTQEVNK